MYDFLNKNKINYRKKVASRVLASANKIFMTYGIMAENLNQGYDPDYHKKVIEIHLPNLIDRKLPNNVNKDSNEVIATYAGLFYSDIRRPNEMLDILSKFPKEFTIQIFGVGCENTLKEKKSLFTESKLEIKGRIPFQECLNELSKSNILINLGNKITNQMPSKVFEYISFGKPILNFYNTTEDPSLKYFKDYPLCYSINVNHYNEDDINNAIKFCLQNKNKQLTFKESTQNLEYCVADNVGKLIFEQMKTDE